MSHISTYVVKPWPSVSFLLPVLNGGTLLKGLLQSIRAQDYPGPVEIIMADGGSTDDSVAIAKGFQARVLPNPHILAEPGAALAHQHAVGDILFYIAADNGLPRPDWLRSMVQPFLDSPDVMGSYTQIIGAPGDNSFTEYYCRLHVEPFTWFVYGMACNPRHFHKFYSVRHRGSNWIAYDFQVLRHPLIAFAQGFGVRRSFVRRAGYDKDDILPVIQLIEEGADLAYVPAAGVYHHHLSSFGHFVRKYSWRINNSLGTNDSGFDNRAKFLTRTRRLKKYVFAVYGVTVVLPVIDAAVLAIKERRACMLWHAPASVALSWVALFAYGRHWLRRLGLR